MGGRWRKRGCEWDKGEVVDGYWRIKLCKLRKLVIIGGKGFVCGGKG